MCDKVSRLGNVLFGVPDQVGESVEDTLKDLANYADILLQAWREKNPKVEDIVDYADAVEAVAKEIPEAAPPSILKKFFRGEL